MKVFIFLIALLFNDLFTGKYSPSFNFRPRCKRLNLRLGEFQTSQIISLIRRCVLANVSRAETIRKRRRSKITRCENNPVYSISETFSHMLNM